MIFHYCSEYIYNWISRHHKGKKLNWFEGEMNITDISGLSIIDLRYNKKF